MVIRIDLLTGRVDDGRLSKEQLNMLVERNYVAPVRCFGKEIRFYGNREKFEGLQDSQRLHDLFAGRVIDGKFVCPSSAFKWSGIEDMTKLDIESVSGHGINSERIWKEFAVE